MIHRTRIRQIFQAKYITPKLVNAMSSVPISEALNYLDTFRQFIDDDIPAAISGNANYLAALELGLYGTC